MLHQPGRHDARHRERKPKHVQERLQLRVSRLGAEPDGLRPSVELSRENWRAKERATPRALQCSLIYGPGAHTQSYTRYHNTINSSSNSPLTESYWPRSKSHGATNVSMTSARCLIFFEPRGQVDPVLASAELLLPILAAPPHYFSTALESRALVSAQTRGRSLIGTRIVTELCAGGFAYWAFTRGIAFI